MEEEVVFGMFILIKDSISEESIVIKSSDNHYDLIDELESIIENENVLRKEENERPPTLMERKHPDYRCIFPMLKGEETKKDKEIIRYGDGRISYRIEEL